MGPAMNVYIWKRIENATNNYHPEGAVVVVANTVEEAVSLAASEGANIVTPPDVVYQLAAEETKTAFIFRDAGCC